MHLAENIYRLRTQKNLSQGDLADALGVSRQSVSKWENDSAVPELDKLIKMAQLFEVSMDALVADTAPVSKASEAKVSAPAPVSPEVVKAPSPTAGIILLCCALLVCLLLGNQWGFLAGVFFASPLFICGILCLVLKRRRGLWCCWVLFFFALRQVYIGTGAGLSSGWVYLASAFSSPASAHYLIISLVASAIKISLSVWTVLSYKAAAAYFVARKRVHLILGWVLATIPSTVMSILSAFHVTSIGSQAAFRRLFFMGIFYTHWVHVAAQLIMLTITVGCLTQAKVSRT